MSSDTLGLIVREIHPTRRRHPWTGRPAVVMYIGVSLAVAFSSAAVTHTTAAAARVVNPSTHLRAGVTPVIHSPAQPTTGRSAPNRQASSQIGPPPHLTYYGGHVISHVSVIEVLYGSGTYEPEVLSTTAPSIASFYQATADSFYFDWLSEYNTGSQAIGRGGFLRQIMITPALANDQAIIDDTNIEAELVAQENANHLPAPDGNTLLAVYFPAGKTITLGNQASGVNFCGFHGTTSQPEMYYSVLPDFSTGGMATNCGRGTEFQNLTAVSSHELVEATTDPEVGLATNLAPPLAWYDTSNGEIADICLLTTSDLTLGDGRQYRLQAEWSNRQGACVVSGGQGIAAVNGGSSWVVSSNGSGHSFGAPAEWSSQPFYGSAATLSGDVVGSGHDALVAVNSSSVWVMSSDGSSFSAPALWASTSIVGSRATLLADVNGDGRADLVAVSDHGTEVMLSTGSSFSPPVTWSALPFFGNRATLAADVTGDGKADLVAVNDGSIFVMSSNGSSFYQPALWSTNTFYGSHATLAGDVSGDGLADVVAINGDSVWVIRSTGSGFGAPEAWLGSPIYGSRANILADATGDGVDDIVAVNDASVYVAGSTRTGFNQPSDWLPAHFYGDRATLPEG